MIQRLQQLVRIITELNASPRAAAANKYAAFISHNRGLDAKTAVALQESLQRFGKPWYRLRSFRVFRDDSSLSANPDLWASVEAALKESEFLILLASPPAAASAWVRREVEYWLSNKAPEKLLLAITAGKLPNELNPEDTIIDGRNALPAILSTKYAKSPPRFVDLRWIHRESQLSLSDPRFRDCVADLGAPLHHLPKADLVSEEVFQHRRTVRIARITVAVLSILTLVAAAAAVAAVNQRQVALTQLDLATSRQLAGDSKLKTVSDPQLSALLALAAYRVRDTPEARGAMLNALQRLPTVERILSNEAISVNAVALSPDGKTLAAGDGSGAVELWDMETKRVIASLRGGMANVLALQFSPDGTLLAAGGEGASPYGPGELAIWNVATHAEKISLPAHWYGVRTLAFSADGMTLAFGGGHKTAPADAATLSGTGDNPFGMDVILLEVASLRQVGALRGHTNSVLSLAFTPDSSTLVSAGYSETLSWDMQNRTPHTDLPQSADAIAVSPDGGTLAIGALEGLQGRVILRNTRDQIDLGTLLEPELEFFKVSAIAFSPDGSTLAVAGMTGYDGISAARLTLWDIATMTQITNLTGHTGPVNTLAFAPDGTVLASGSADGTTILWSMDGGDRLGRALPNVIVESAGDLHFTADGGRLVAIGRPVGSVRASVVVGWDVGTTAPISVLEPRKGYVHDAAFSPEVTLVVEETPTSILVSDVRSGGRVIAEAPVGAGGAFGSHFELSPDRRTLTIASAGSGVTVWDLLAPSEWKRLGDPYGNAFMRTVYSPDSARIAAYGADAVYVWDVESGSEIMRLDDGGQHIVDLDFAPDGRSIAGISLAGKVLVWNLIEARLQAVLTGHTGPGGSIAFSPDGTLLASGARDEVILWDVARGAEIGSMPGRTPSAGLVAFSPDGQTLAIGGMAPSLYNVSAQSWYEQLCDVVGREFTPQEWASYVPGRDFEKLCSP